jgi:hypothetical protein
LNVYEHVFFDVYLMFEYNCEYDQDSPFFREVGEFYIPMGQAPHFVKDEQLNELGGKPEVIESMFSVRLHALRQQRTGTEEVRDVLHVLVYYSSCNVEYRSLWAVYTSIFLPSLIFFGD